MEEEEDGVRRGVSMESLLDLRRLTAADIRPIPPREDGCRRIPAIQGTFLLFLLSLLKQTKIRGLLDNLRTRDLVRSVSLLSLFDIMRVVVVALVLVEHLHQVGKRMAPEHGWYAITFAGRILFSFFPLSNYIYFSPIVARYTFVLLPIPTVADFELSF